MTNRKLSLFLSLCAIATLFLFACQKQEIISNNTPTKNDPVKPRTDCVDCADMDDCCCFVELDDDNAATIHICGITDVGSACASGDMGNCISGISGLGTVISLGTGNPKQIFCMAPNSSIRIINIAPSDNAGIRVGCNTASYSPIEYNIAAQDSVKAEVNSLMNCELGDCSN